MCHQIICTDLRDSFLHTVNSNFKMTCTHKTVAIGVAVKEKLKLVKCIAKAKACLKATNESNIYFQMRWK